MTRRRNRQIIGELDRLVLAGLIGPKQAQELAARYPVTPWDVLVLVRWLTLLGAVTAGAGALVLAAEVAGGLRVAELGVGAATATFLWLARVLARRGLERTGAAVELAAGFALQGLTVLLAIDFSTGSKNWPALLGLDTALLVALAYWLRNRLVLVHAAICFFVFFGAETGYASGWGLYWLGLSYPLRYLPVAAAMLAVAYLHLTWLRGAWQSFGRVYLHVGLLALHLALWFLSVFGVFGEHASWLASEGERVAFSALWALVSVGCLWLAGTLGQRSLRAYGLVFLIVDVYTFYFQFVVARSGALWWLHLLLTGSSLVWLGVTLERRLRGERAQASSASSSSA